MPAPGRASRPVGRPSSWPWPAPCLTRPRPAWRRWRLSLHYLSSSRLADKLLKEPPARVEFTRVNGREAFWTTGPYIVVARSGLYSQMRLVTGHVLIWYEGEITYRLETDLSLEEAVKIAESLE